MSEAIGIPLELEGHEVPVDTFSADILARNPLDDSLILIENQLEKTDHTHLGQIMTYLAGLNAQTVIWIAADFRDAYLSALKWLNDHTVEPFAFFAVKVKAVRIGNSPIAPLFEVLIQPNQWERSIQVAIRPSGQMSSLGQFRMEFWSFYVNRFPDELTHGNAGGTSSRWRTFSDSNLAVTTFLAQKEVGVFIRGLRGASNQEVYDLLEKHNGHFSNVTQATIGSPERPHFFISSRAGDTTNRETWAQLADWLHQTADRYELALAETFRAQASEISTSLASETMCTKP